MWHRLDWPIPPDSEYLKRDSQSLGLLRRAEAEFRALLEGVEIDSQEQLGLEAWRLACLACDVDRKPEASAYAKKLLTRNPQHVPAAVWAIQRGLEFDKEKFSQALKTGAQWGELLPDAA